jgi:quercetin dioxygenase-like cupin family protein
MDRARAAAARGRTSVVKRGALWLTAASAVIGGWSGAAPANVPSEAQRAAQAIEKTLQRHGTEVHRCFERALADRLDVSGKVEIEVEVGEGGKVSKARALSQDKQSAALSPCLVASASGWHVDGIEAGASVVLPFDFAGQMNQFVVKSGDTPERGPGAAKLKEQDKDSKPRNAPPFTVKVLADSVNVRAQQLSLTLLSVGPASRVAMHRHPRSAKVLYLLKGHARLLGPPGTEPEKIDEGTAVFLPAGYPHVIENMGRQTTAVFLQAFAPPGPERVYRDPKDPAGRADFEVIRDPAKAKAPPHANGQLVIKSTADVHPISILGGKGSARILLEPQDTGSPSLALDVIEWAPGTEVPRHQHPGSAEVLYVVSGGGTLTVGSESYPFAAEDAIHIPADQPHAAKFAPGDKTIAIQFYAPAGPEQRFHGTAPQQPPVKK